MRALADVLLLILVQLDDKVIKQSVPNWDLLHSYVNHPDLIGVQAAP